ncbi:putative conserved protein UCP014753 [Actinobacteria bacterium OK074]|nr:putative conserved protein UCP014753 [Actinobacteria bacterium OK074]
MPAPYVELPPPDPVLSPRTGWTRAHWEALADRLLDALVPYATPGLAQYRLPGRGSPWGLVLDGLEGFAHSFLLASFRIAGSGGSGGEVDSRLLERYARGLTTGTDRDSGEAWPPLTDSSPQMAHAASIAIGLHESRRWIWSALDPDVQERIVDWLWGFVGRRAPEGHGALFQAVAEQFLASVGGPYRQEDIDGGLDRLEDWYAGGGWYTDGDGRVFDHANSWALHLYPMLWTRMAGERDAGRGLVYRRRLAEFLAVHPYLFGADGAPVHHGRSLAHRFAAVAPVWLGALEGCSPLPPGQTRRLASGAVRHFVERGVPDARGLLPLGWYGTFLPAARPTSALASSYAAVKAFLGLLLPADHPVWTEPERPLPVEESDHCTAVPAPGWLLHGTRNDGIVRLVNHGSGPELPEDEPHLAKFGYSTASGPEAGSPSRQRNVDGHLALLSPDDAPSHRRGIRLLRCSGRLAASRHTAQLPGTAVEFGVESTSVVHGPWEVRVHRVRPRAGVAVREGGYAVADETRPAAEGGPGWALARTADGLTSAVVALYGWGEDTGVVARAAEANAFGPHSATPYLRRAAGSSDRRGVYVTLLVLSRDAVHPGALREAVECAVADDDEVRITFPDGDTVVVRAA